MICVGTWVQPWVTSWSPGALVKPGAFSVVVFSHFYISFLLRPRHRVQRLPWPAPDLLTQPSGSLIRLNGGKSLFFFLEPQTPASRREKHVVDLTIPSDDLTFK